MEKKRDKIASGNAVWVNLTASYGCNLVAVCQAVDLVALDDASELAAAEAASLG